MFLDKGLFTMPSVDAVAKPAKVTNEILKEFIAKLKEAESNSNLLDFWEKELKSEAKRVFTLIPIEIIESSVFRELETLSTNKNKSTKEVFKHQTKSRNSLRRSLIGSESSLSSKLTTFSFVDTCNKVNIYIFSVFKINFCY